MEVSLRENELLIVATQLVAARSEEASLSMRCCRHPDDDVLYLEWARARQRVEDCQAAYIAHVERAGWPDEKIRLIVED